MSIWYFSLIAKLKKLFHSAKNHAGFKRYFANTSWMFAEQFLRILSGLLVGVWVARYLGPEQFGVFSYAIAFVSIFASIAKLGMDRILVRDLVKESEMRDTYLGTAFWLKIVGATFSLSIISIALLFTNNDFLTNVYILIIASGIVFQVFEVIDFYFQSKVLSKYVSLSKIAQLILSSILRIYFVLTNADLIWFVMVTLIDQATLAIALCLAYRQQKIGFFYRYFDLNIAKKLLTNSWPLMLSGVVLMVQARADQIMLKEMIGTTEVGYFSAAMRLIEVFSFVPVLIVNSLFPAIVNAKKVSIQFYYKRLFSLYRLMMILFLAVAIPVFLFGNQIVILLYGQAYAPAGYLFSLMALRLFFTNYGVARGAYLMAENLVQYSLLTMILGTIFNLLLNYYWIPIYSSKGAICASYASFFISTFLVDMFYIKAKSNFNLMFTSFFLLNFRKKLVNIQ